MTCDHSGKTICCAIAMSLSPVFNCVADAQQAQGGAPYFPATVSDDHLSLVPVTLTKFLHSHQVVFRGDTAILITEQNGEYMLMGFVPERNNEIWSTEIAPVNGEVGRHLAISPKGQLYLIGAGVIRTFDFDGDEPDEAPVEREDRQPLVPDRDADCTVVPDKAPAISSDGSLAIVASTVSPCASVSKHLIVYADNAEFSWSDQISDTRTSAPVWGQDGRFVYLTGNASGLMAYAASDPSANARLDLPNQNLLRSDGTWTFQTPVLRVSDKGWHSVAVAANTYNAGALMIASNTAPFDDKTSATPQLRPVWQADRTGWCGQWGALMAAETTAASEAGGEILVPYRRPTGSCTSSETGQNGLATVRWLSKESSDVPTVALTGSEFALFPGATAFHPAGVIFGRARTDNEVIASDLSGTAPRSVSLKTDSSRQVVISISPERTVYITDSAGTARSASLLSTGVTGLEVSDTTVTSKGPLVIDQVTTSGTVKFTAASALRVRPGSTFSSGTTFSMTKAAE